MDSLNATISFSTIALGLPYGLSADLKWSHRIAGDGQYKGLVGTAGDLLACQPWSSPVSGPVVNSSMCLYMLLFVETCANTSPPGAAIGNFTVEAYTYSNTQDFVLMAMLVTRDFDGSIISANVIGAWSQQLSFCRFFTRRFNQKCCVSQREPSPPQALASQLQNFLLMASTSGQPVFCL
jgi:hypothetical protein